jgi:hypothetical protein
MKDDEEGKGNTEKEKEGTLIPIKKEKEKKADHHDRSIVSHLKPNSLSAAVEEEEEEGVEILKLTAEEGAIVFKKHGMDLVVPTGESSEIDSEDTDEVVNTITYMLYALERQDWKDEFISILDEQLQKEEEVQNQEEVQRRRSHLKVIK